MKGTKNWVDIAPITNISHLFMDYVRAVDIPEDDNIEFGEFYTRNIAA